MILIDTKVAIHLRDGHADTVARIASLPQQPAISVATQVELEGRVVAKPGFAAIRRAALDALLLDMTVYSFGPQELAAYRNIVEVLGYSRNRLLDRMIAGTAVVHDLTLVTMNGADFTNIPGLKLGAWDAPA